MWAPRLRGSHWFLGAAGAIVLGVALFFVLRSGAPIEETAALVRDDSRFSTSRESAETFVVGGERLRNAGRACIETESAQAPPCEAMLAGAAYMEIAAVRVIDCTRPSIFRARRAMVDFLDELRIFIESPERTDLPEPPPLPEC